MCHVEGGPDYEVTLLGDASLISYKISGEKQNNSYMIDFGQIRFSETVYKDFYIENTGKVAFGYKISLDKLVRKGLIDVNPQMGRI